MSKIIFPGIHRRDFLVGAAGLGLAATILPGHAQAQGQGGTIRFGTLGLDTSDPHRHTGSIGVQQVYVEALTSIGPDGAVEPWLAEEIDVAEDGLNYTFTLRENVRFHDGETLTAADVVANINRVREEITGGWLATAMAYVSSVEAPDERTVVLTMSEPYAPLLNLMSELWIVSPRSPGWDSTITNPIGTGPFTFGSWRPQDSFSGPAFEDYWVEGLPRVSEVWFDLRDTADKSLALQAGDLHIAVVSVEAAETLTGAGVARIGTLKDTNFFSVSFNNRSPRPPFDDPRVRQAIGYAIDKQAFMAFEGGPTATAGNQLTPPGNFYFDQAMHDADPFAKPDLDKARALLEEAGVNSADHMIRFVSWQEDYAQIIVQMVRQLGFQVDHAALDDVGAQQRWASNDWDLNVASSGPRADLFLRYVRLMSDGPNPTLWGNIQDPELDDLIDRASKEPADDQRRQLYLDAMQLVNDKLYFIVLGHVARLIGIRNEVEDFDPGFTYSPHWASGGVAHASLQS